MDENTDFIATELLKELKDSNTRKDHYIAQVHKQHMLERLGYLVAILLVVAGFLWYLNQYDFSSTEEYHLEATGVYALVDSEGNIIAQDLTPEEMTKIMEVLGTYGDSASDGQENTAKD